MLPNIRSEEYLYAIPKYEINGDDVRGFMDELEGFHEVFSDCFYRSESRNHFFQYMVGQFSALERKSIEPIALNVKRVPGTSSRDTLLTSSRDTLLN